MMGVGKSTIGKLLSKKLKMKFVDTDTEIEKKMKMTIPQIFKQRSEAFFRAKERNVASQFLNNHNQVIALGGGTFLNREIIDSEDSSFWIEFRNIANSNIRALELCFYLEAINFIKSGKNLDDVVDFSEISENAYDVLCKNESDIVKFCK